MRLFEQFFGIIAPNTCIFCDQEGSLLCKWCIDDALPYQTSRCYLCNALTKYYKSCPSCRHKTQVKHVYVRSEYTSFAKELVHRMKFKYSIEAVKIIAFELVQMLPITDRELVITNVPTVTSHQRSRGIDHTKKIAQEMSRLSGKQYVETLVRTDQARQVGSSRKDRLTQLNGVFRIKNTDIFKGVDIILVDDIMTTGATIESATSTLKFAGAKSVSAIVFSRAK